jgi:uncharacterized protein DUF6922
MMRNKPNLPDYLLWEYDLTTFNYENSYKIVIERVLIMGTIEDWKEMIRFYPMEKIMGTIEWSKQLGKREKDFAKLFLQSDLLKSDAA